MAPQAFASNKVCFLCWKGADQCHCVCGRVVAVPCAIQLSQQVRPMCRAEAWHQVGQCLTPLVVEPSDGDEGPKPCGCGGRRGLGRPGSIRAASLRPGRREGASPSPEAKPAVVLG